MVLPARQVTELETDVYTMMIRDIQALQKSQMKDTSETMDWKLNGEELANLGTHALSFMTKDQPFSYLMHLILYKIRQICALYKPFQAAFPKFPAVACMYVKNENDVSPSKIYMRDIAGNSLYAHIVRYKTYLSNPNANRNDENQEAVQNVGGETIAAAIATAAATAAATNMVRDNLGDAAALAVNLLTPTALVTGKLYMQNRQVVTPKKADEANLLLIKSIIDELLKNLDLFVSNYPIKEDTAEDIVKTHRKLMLNKNLDILELMKAMNSHLSDDKLCNATWKDANKTVGTPLFKKHQRKINQAVQDQAVQDQAVQDQAVKDGWLCKAPDKARDADNEIDVMIINEIYDALVYKPALDILATLRNAEQDGDRSKIIRFHFGKLDSFVVTELLALPIDLPLVEFRHINDIRAVIEKHRPVSCAYVKSQMWNLHEIRILDHSIAEVTKYESRFELSQDQYDALMIRLEVQCWFFQMSPALVMKIPPESDDSAHILVFTRAFEVARQRVDELKRNLSESKIAIMESSDPVTKALENATNNAMRGVATTLNLNADELVLFSKLVSAFISDLGKQGGLYNSPRDLGLIIRHILPEVGVGTSVDHLMSEWHKLLLYKNLLACYETKELTNQNGHKYVIISQVGDTSLRPTQKKLISWYKQRLVKRRDHLESIVADNISADQLHDDLTTMLTQVPTILGEYHATIQANYLKPGPGSSKFCENNEIDPNVMFPLLVMEPLRSAMMALFDRKYKDHSNLLQGELGAICERLSHLWSQILEAHPMLQKRVNDTIQTIITFSMEPYLPQVKVKGFSAPTEKIGWVGTATKTLFTTSGAISTASTAVDLVTAGAAYVPFLFSMMTMVTLLYWGNWENEMHGPSVRNILYDLLGEVLDANNLGSLKKQLFESGGEHNPFRDYQQWEEKPAWNSLLYYFGEGGEGGTSPNRTHAEHFHNKQVRKECAVQLKRFGEMKSNIDKLQCSGDDCKGLDSEWTKLILVFWVELFRFVTEDLYSNRCKLPYPFHNMTFLPEDVTNAHEAFSDFLKSANNNIVQENRPKVCYLVYRAMVIMNGVSWDIYYKLMPRTKDDSLLTVNKQTTEQLKKLTEDELSDDVRYMEARFSLLSKELVEHAKDAEVFLTRLESIKSDHEGSDTGTAASEIVQLLKQGGAGDLNKKELLLRTMSDTLRRFRYIDELYPKLLTILRDAGFKFDARELGLTPQSLFVYYTLFEGLQTELANNAPLFLSNFTQSLFEALADKDSDLSRTPDLEKPLKILHLFIGSSGTFTGKMLQIIREPLEIAIGKEKYAYWFGASTKYPSMSPCEISVFIRDGIYERRNYPDTTWFAPPIPGRDSIRQEAMQKINKFIKPQRMASASVGQVHEIYKKKNPHQDDPLEKFLDDVNGLDNNRLTDLDKRWMHYMRLQDGTSSIDDFENAIKLQADYVHANGFIELLQFAKNTFGYFSNLIGLSAGVQSSNTEYNTSFFPTSKDVLFGQVAKVLPKFEDTISIEKNFEKLGKKYQELTRIKFEKGGWYGQEGIQNKLLEYLEGGVNKVRLQIMSEVRRLTRNRGFNFVNMQHGISNALATVASSPTVAELNAEDDILKKILAKFLMDQNIKTCVNEDKGALKKVEELLFSTFKRVHSIIDEGCTTQDTCQDLAKHETENNISIMADTLNTLNVASLFSYSNYRRRILGGHYINRVEPSDDEFIKNVKHEHNVEIVKIPILIKFLKNRQRILLCAERRAFLGPMTKLLADSESGALQVIGKKEAESLTQTVKSISDIIQCKFHDVDGEFDLSEEITYAAHALQIYSRKTMYLTNDYTMRIFVPGNWTTYKCSSILDLSYTEVQEMKQRLIDLMWIENRRNVSDLRIPASVNVNASACNTLLGECASITKETYMMSKLGISIAMFYKLFTGVKDTHKKGAKKDEHEDSVVQERAPGETINDLLKLQIGKKDDKRALSGTDLLRFLIVFVKFVMVFLTEMIQTGKFHGDPHPGNIMMSIDSEINMIQLSLIDFGDFKVIPDTMHLIVKLVLGYIYEHSKIVKSRIPITMLADSVAFKDFLAACQRTAGATDDVLLDLLDTYTRSNATIVDDILISFVIDPNNILKVASAVLHVFPGQNAPAKDWTTATEERTQMLLGFASNFSKKTNGSENAAHLLTKLKNEILKDVTSGKFGAFLRSKERLHNVLYGTVIAKECEYDAVYSRVVLDVDRVIFALIKLSNSFLKMVDALLSKSSPPSALSKQVSTMVFGDESYAKYIHIITDKQYKDIIWHASCGPNTELSELIYAINVAKDKEMKGLEIIANSAHYIKSPFFEFSQSDVRSQELLTALNLLKVKTPRKTTSDKESLKQGGSSGKNVALNKERTLQSPRSSRQINGVRNNGGRGRLG
jgi:hypothetical protein